MANFPSDCPARRLSRMKHRISIILLLLLSVSAYAQETDTVMLRQAVSKSDTITYIRTIRFDTRDSLYRVQDFFTSGQIHYIHVDIMDGHFVPNMTVGPLIVSALKPLTRASGTTMASSNSTASSETA